ncbi:hypothetical protein Tco_0978063 [Tanacetum coccineum]|uniref:Uncharacterized protein n=1 Tax=Tanacetum coccineum TaxID=301880 RepID=A0ABQ5ELV2_9ASTR
MGLAFMSHKATVRGVPEFKLPNQEFIVPPSSDPEIVSFIRELRLHVLDRHRFTSVARKENMPYPRFNKAIIQHFISKDKSISMRNRQSMHIVQDDSILGSLKVVSKTEEYQVYRALIPARMTNKKMQNSPTYKTYLAFTTGATTPKKARKFKKLASSSKKITLVAVEEPTKKPSKKPTARR